MTIRVVTREEFMRRLENELEEHRMTVEEFRAEGEADTLTGGNLRDMWLMYWPVLFDDDLRNERGGGRGLADERDRVSGSPGSARPNAIVRDRHTRPREIPVRYITREELWQEMEDCLAEERMTVEEFRAEGEADTLTDGYLRDMWLMYRPLLFDDDSDDGFRSDGQSLDVERDRNSGVSGTARRSVDSTDQDRVSDTPTVRYFTREELWQEMEAHLAGCRMTVDEFRAEGEADTLTDGHLRDLWLWYRPLLFDD